MTKVNADISQIREFGNDVLVAVDSYKQNVNNLFEKMNGVPTKTKEWIGEASNNYVTMISNDRNQYDSYGDGLEKFGNQLLDYADKLDDAIKNTRIG